MTGSDRASFPEFCLEIIAFDSIKLKFRVQIPFFCLVIFTVFSVFDCIGTISSKLFNIFGDNFLIGKIWFKLVIRSKSTHQEG